MVRMAERLMLDTHALIWALADPDELTADARGAIDMPANTILVSPASLYEINLKVALGKLHAPAVDLVDSIEAIGFTELPLRLVHAALAGRLPFHHRDPFDGSSTHRPNLSRAGASVRLDLHPRLSAPEPISGVTKDDACTLRANSNALGSQTKYWEADYAV